MRLDVFNAQMQPKVSWPPTTVVARAYLDQLNRTSALDAARVAAVKSALDKTEKGKPNKAAIDQLDTVAQQLEQAAASASGKDAERMKALASTMKGRASRLRTN